MPQSSFVVQETSVPYELGLLLVGVLTITRTNISYTLLVGVLTLRDLLCGVLLKIP